MIHDFNPRPNRNTNFTKHNSDSSQDKGPADKQDQQQQKCQQEQIDQPDKNMSFYSQNSKFVPNSPTNPLQNNDKKIRFQQIKPKLTTPIIIRLLSYDSGIELAEKYFPDWLDQQFQKWMSPQHNYCTTLENKLSGALNFVKKKEKGFYKITSNSHVYDLLFMYKLPWLLHANQQKFPLWIRQKGQSYQFYANFGLGSDLDSPQFMIDNDSLKIMLGIGTMLVDEQFNVISGLQNSSPLTIFLTMNPKKVEIYGKKMLLVQSNGVQIYYRKSQGAKNAMKDRKQQMSMSEQWQYYSSHVNDINKIQIMRIVINVKLPTVEHTQQLPLHLINQLTKTKKGREFIQKKKYVQKCADVLKKYNNNESLIPNLIQVRSILWSLGFYGSRNEGIKILNQNKIFENIIKMTFHSPTLSLRGTCRYILNMFSHSEYGRNLLMQNGFNVNSRTFTCYPTDIKKFYSIAWPQFSKRHFILDDRYWQSYNQLQKPMTKNEQKLFQLISLLINSLSFKSAVAQIRQILKISPKIANSINLLQNIVNLLTFFKYKHESRKSIINIFDQIIKSPDFNSQVGDKIVFYISEDQTKRKLSIELQAKSSTNLQNINQKVQQHLAPRTQQFLK